MTALERYVELQRELKEYYRVNQLEQYSPYPYQLAFHHCPRGLVVNPFEVSGPVSPVRTLLTGNKMGKTWCGANEVAMHATGKYPDWWKGIRFSYPVECLVAGVSNDKTRDICQKFLFGEPSIEGMLGTGAVPKSCIGDTTRKPGVPNAYDNVLVRHHTNGKFDGWSKVMFQAYEQKKNSFMGIPIDVGWVDEEPPMDVFNQFVRGVIAKSTYTILLTFTAESGGTDLVYKTLHELGDNQGLVRAGWRDAPHIWDVPGKIDELKSLFPKYEWAMRENGDPVVGTGRVFAIDEADISIEPIPIPSHWPRIIGIDYGLEHPFVAAWLALDPNTDTSYIYDIFSRSDLSLADMVMSLKRHGDIPVAWPHDMAKRATGVSEGNSGKTISLLFSEAGANMLESHFSNPPEFGMREEKGNNSVSAGIVAMTNAFSQGKLKVFNTLPEWFVEFRNYHTENGLIVKVHDDRMDASRYAYQSRRFAKVINQNWSTGKPIRAKVSWSGLH